LFEILFLGTAGTIPTRDRGLPALLVMHRRRRFLVDCGEGTAQQIIRSGIGFRRLDTIFLTHGHLDHTLGLAGLAATLELVGAGSGLSIHAGRDALDFARRLLCDIVWAGEEPSLRLRFLELAPGPVWEADRLRISAFPVRHRAPDSFGFVFEEVARPHMSEERLAALEVPPGPLRLELESGRPVMLPGGRRIAPEQVMAEARPGARVVIVGDTESAEEVLAPARGADLLIIEASFMAADAELARARSHLTAAEAGWLAARAGVRRLCLTHVSSRYDPAALEAEARAYFPRARIVRDFERVLVRASR
jgi:ribonuclease Z